MVGRLGFLSTLAIAAALAGCTSTGPRPIASIPRPTQSEPTKPVPPTAGYGRVIGGIYRCFGLPPSMSGPPTRVAGTVDVFRGPNDGLPDAVIKTDGEYAFELPPGEYVLVGHWTGSNLSPPMVTVAVSSGKITRQDLDYGRCI